MNITASFWQNKIQHLQLIYISISVSFKPDVGDVATPLQMISTTRQSYMQPARERFQVVQ